MYSYHKGGSVYITILGCDTVIFSELTRITARIPVGYRVLCLNDSNKNQFNAIGFELKYKFFISKKLSIALM